MRRPSIRLRLVIGTGLVLATMLGLTGFAIYRAFEKSVNEEVESQLIQSALMVAKSSELESSGVVYEWEEALSSPDVPPIKGLFKLWDMTTRKETHSPDLGDDDLPFFHGAPNEVVIRDIVLADGHVAKAVGLLHYPFTDARTEAEAMDQGRSIQTDDHPQVVVFAREVDFLKHKLTRVRQQLSWATFAMLMVTWGAISGITTWTLRPIRDFSESILTRKGARGKMIPAKIPAKLPAEMVDLAEVFEGSLAELEMLREREREFVLHAAHELRTPVAGMMATLEQAVMRPREASDLVSRIQEALRITAGMRLTLDSLMRLARLRGGLHSVQGVEIDVCLLIQDVLQGLEGKITDNGVSIENHFPLSCVIKCDEGLLKVLLSNLIENAIHHSPHHGTVVFRAELMENQLVFSTLNSKGCLEENDLVRIFEPFQRASSEDGSSAGHAGLGLSLARESAKLLGGLLQARIEGDSVVFVATIRVW